MALPVAADGTRDTDVLFLKSGDRRPGDLIEVDDQFFRLRVDLIPGQPPAQISIPATEVDYVQFAGEEDREEFLRAATLEQLPHLAAEWEAEEKYLSLPRSPAGRIGNVYGDLLLRSGEPDNAPKALELFNRIEEQAWDQEQRNVARQGRLRAMVATGDAANAVEEALEIAEASEDPEILIEAKYILAQASDAELRELVEENPRWQEDIRVRPERHRLYNEALDLYLYPYLFYGSDTEAASRGLWSAVEIYRFSGDTIDALESARDLVTIYPETQYARLADEFIQSLPEEITHHDTERDAQD